MKSNSVFLIFAATVIIVGILLARLFANAPAKMADNVEKKTAEAIALAPSPAPTASPSPSPTPTATATPAASPTPTAAATGARIDPQVEADFLALRTHALDMIPTNADVQKLSTSQVHFTPQAVIDAASEIGRVTEMLEAHPELAARGLQFYKECAENEASVESVRATCLSDFTSLRKRSGSNATPPKVPKRVALIAEKISS